MATTKVTVTLDNDQLARIRELVRAGQSPNVSAFVKHAVGVSLDDVAGWREMLKEALDQTGGPLTKEELEWADNILSPAAGKKASRKRKAA
ncbi:MAG: ribbon-helix-helix protein, CopG family [Bryobacterales bacterium]|nr:ribbon-helix-helix protein, CopG family [Bryobacterales bacterium]